MKHKSEVIQVLIAQEFGQMWKGFSESKWVYIVSCVDSVLSQITMRNSGL